LCSCAALLVRSYRLLMTEASGQSATYSDASIVRSGSYSDALVLGVRCTRLFFLD